VPPDITPGDLRRRPQGDDEESVLPGPVPEFPSDVPIPGGAVAVSPEELARSAQQMAETVESVRGLIARIPSARIVGEDEIATNFKEVHGITSLNVEVFFGNLAQFLDRTSEAMLRMAADYQQADEETSAIVDGLIS
jgi:uncharacterized protein YukE